MMMAHLMFQVLHTALTRHSKSTSALVDHCAWRALRPTHCSYQLEGPMHATCHRQHNCLESVQHMAGCGVPETSRTPIMVDAMNQPSRNLVETPMGAQVDMKKLMRANGVEAAIIHLRRPKRVGVLSDSHATSGAARNPSRADIGRQSHIRHMSFHDWMQGGLGCRGAAFYFVQY